MSEEWRKLPEFPKYEITSDGDIRRRDTKKPINETFNASTGAWSYCLYKNNGKSTHRSCWTLIYSAYPELKPEPEFKDIPEWPGYQINRKGDVKNRKQAYLMTHHHEYVGEYSNIKIYVRLRKDRITHKVAVYDLLVSVYGDEEKEAA